MNLKRISDFSFLMTKTTTTKTAIISILKKLTNHDYIEIVTRGNSAISSALALVPKDKKVLIPEEGGWLYYRTAPKQLGLEAEEVKCQDAKINLQDLETKLSTKKYGAFLYQNPGGYFAEQPGKEIYQLCKKNDCLVILDVSGSIGTKLGDGKYADIIIGSFGTWKLVEAKVGGFISSNDQKLWKMIKFEKLENEADLFNILQQLEKLPQRISYLKNIRNKIIHDLDNLSARNKNLSNSNKNFSNLSKLSIVHKNDLGFVVVVKFSNSQEKETIINYCKDNKLEYTECPRYIRLNQKAISIEVKRRLQRD